MPSLVCLPKIEVFVLLNSTFENLARQNKMEKVKRKTRKYEKEEDWGGSEDIKNYKQFVAELLATGKQKKYWYKSQIHMPMGFKNNISEGGKHGDLSYDPETFLI